MQLSICYSYCTQLSLCYYYCILFEENVIVTTSSEVPFKVSARFTHVHTVHANLEAVPFHRHRKQSPFQCIKQRRRENLPARSYLITPKTLDRCRSANVDANAASLATPQCRRRTTDLCAHVAHCVCPFLLYGLHHHARYVDNIPGSRHSRSSIINLPLAPKITAWRAWAHVCGVLCRSPPPRVFRVRVHPCPPHMCHWRGAHFIPSMHGWTRPLSTHLGISN
jgi:hypothetical protein